MSEYNDNVVPGTLTVLSADKVIVIAVEPGVELVSSEGMTGRPDSVEVLTVVENDNVGDADSTSTLVADSVILKCITGSVAELP